MEDLLTKFEIEDIIKQSKLSDYSYLFGLIPSKNKSMISQVCQFSGLILVNGNQWTGYQHIYERHSGSSRLPYWRNKKIDPPTKFKESIAPIHYLNIAKSIFLPKNKTSIKDDSKSFDMYRGSILDKTGETLEYTLLTYKNTGIIHTLYMSDKNYGNKKAFLNLYRGKVYSCYDLKRCIQTHETPYFNFNNIETYRSIIRVHECERIERKYLQININGKPSLTRFTEEIKLNTIKQFNIEMESNELNGNFAIEKIIKSIETNLKVPKDLLEALNSLNTFLFSDPNHAN